MTAPTAQTDHYIDHPVHDRLYFADRRLNDLRTLNGGDIAGTAHRDRQPLIQEFFFHLGGAIDFLAQAVNEHRKLRLSQDEVTPGQVCRLLRKKHPGDPISVILSELHPATSRHEKKGTRVSLPVPANPYSEDGVFFRIMLFRHFTTHRTNSPFNFNVTIPPGGRDDRAAYLFLDPREPYIPVDNRRVSRLKALDELPEFLRLVRDRCDRVLMELKIL